jgi:hypothetical protein
MARMGSRLPRRASELFPGNCPQGRGKEAARCHRAMDGPSGNPGESEERRIQAATGRLFFGYFLFDCMDAGGTTPRMGEENRVRNSDREQRREQLPRRSKRK